MKAFGRFVIMTGLWFPSVFFRGWVLSRLYDWFVVRQFHVPPLSPGMAYGLAGMLLLAVYVPNWSDMEEHDSVKLATRTIVTGYFLPLLSLLSGWATQRWWL